MPRYLVERTFTDGLLIPMNDVGAATCQTVVANNAEELVTWIHSYVTPTMAPRRSQCAEQRLGTVCQWTASPK